MLACDVPRSESKAAGGVLSAALISQALLNLPRVFAAADGKVLFLGRTQDLG